MEKRELAAVKAPLAMEVFVPIPMLNFPTMRTFKPDLSASKAERIPARPLPIMRRSVKSSSIKYKIAASCSRIEDRGWRQKI